MCDRQNGEISIDRRALLRRSAAAGALVVAAPMGFFGAPAHAAGTFKATHGSGFCNSAFFITHAKQLGKEYGLTLEFVNTPTFAEMVTFLGAGMVDVSVLPYTSFIGLYDKRAPVKIVGGGGIEGCVIVAQPGLDTAAKLKGKTLGTFQMDTLEVLPYDWLKKNGVKFSDITVRYMGNTPEAVEAFKAGALDFICTIEPYASALLNDVKGSVLLSNGVDIYGLHYTDCVLAARTSVIEQHPEDLKALIKAMLKAQLLFEQQREQILEELVGAYYRPRSKMPALAHRGSRPASISGRRPTSSSVASIRSSRWVISKTSPGAMRSTGPCSKWRSRKCRRSIRSCSTNRHDLHSGRVCPGGAVFRDAALAARRRFCRRLAAPARLGNRFCRVVCRDMGTVLVFRLRRSALTAAAAYLSE
jgi:NitT/TauT family transport system substrate-binding protein